MIKFHQYFVPKTCKFLCNGSMNQKSVFCTFTGMISAFRWYMVLAKIVKAVAKHSTTLNFGRSSIYNLWKAKMDMWHFFKKTAEQIWKFLVSDWKYECLTRNHVLRFCIYLQGSMPQLFYAHAKKCCHLAVERKSGLVCSLLQLIFASRLHGIDLL